MKKLLLAAIMYLKLLKREVRFLFRSKEVVNLTSPETPSTSSTRMTRITRDNISPDPVSYSVNFTNLFPIHTHKALLQLAWFRALRANIRE
jgi:hypothetical protein